MANPEYDVALSFAGEDRPFVKACAEALRAAGATVFYDEFERVSLWGKDLYDHLRDVYRNKARFCIMFVSEHYASKNWTTLERQSAQARALEENAEYILPVRFDDTSIPGLNSNAAYLDLRNVSPQELASLILAKLGVSPLKSVTELASSISTLKQQLEAQNTDPDFMDGDPLRHRACPSCGNEGITRVVYWSVRDAGEWTSAVASCPRCGWEEDGLTTNDVEWIKKKYPGIPVDFR